MDIWDFRLIKLGMAAGIIPFEVDKSRRLLLKVRWTSPQSLYFLLVTAISHMMLLLYCVSWGLLIAREGLAFSLRASSWIGAMALACVMELIIIARHEVIVNQLNRTYQLLGQRSPMNLKWQMDKKRSFLLGLLAFGVLPTVALIVHVLFSPGDIYIHKQLEVYRPGFNPIWIWVSYVVHCYSAVICSAGTLFGDTFLIFFSNGYFCHFEGINQNLMLLKQKGPFQAKIKGGLNTMAVELHQNPSEAMPQLVRKSWICETLRANLKSHLKLQQDLNSFNGNFDIVILGFPIQNFVLVLALFFALARGEIPDNLEMAVVTGVGLQFLVRSFIGLSNFGKVHDSGTATKNVLLRDLQIQYEQQHFDPEVIFEVESFLCIVEDVAFKAGPYLTFTKGFLLSYYGALVSYMAILVQSF